MASGQWLVTSEKRPKVSSEGIVGAIDDDAILRFGDEFERGGIVGIEVGGNAGCDRGELLSETAVGKGDIGGV